MSNIIPFPTTTYEENTKVEECSKTEYYLGIAKNVASVVAIVSMLLVFPIGFLGYIPESACYVLLVVFLVSFAGIYIVDALSLLLESDT